MAVPQEPSQLRDHLKGFFYMSTAVTIFKPYTTHYGDTYLRVTLFNAAFLYMYFLHQATTS